MTAAVQRYLTIVQSDLLPAGDPDASALWLHDFVMTSSPPV